MSLACPIPDIYDRIDLLKLAIGKIAPRSLLWVTMSTVDLSRSAIPAKEPFLFMSGITTSETDAFILIHVAESIVRRGRLQHNVLKPAQHCAGINHARASLAVKAGRLMSA